MSDDMNRPESANAGDNPELLRDPGRALRINVLLSIMMFLEFFVWGAWYVTVGNFLADKKMGDWIGWAYSVGPIAGIAAPLFLGIIADRFFAAQKVQAALMLLGGVFMLGAYKMGVDGNALGLIIMLLLHMLCYMPTLGLTNSIAFRNIANREKVFPIIRLFGTVGWIVANIVVSSGFKADKTVTQFVISAIACFAFALFSLFLPDTPPQKQDQAGRPSISSLLGVDTIKLMADSSFAIFMICSFLICIPLAAYYAYAPVYVGKVGVKDVATFMSYGQMLEVLFLLLMPVLFKFLGVKKMLLLGMLAWVVRYGLFALASDDQVMWMVLIGVILHGVCYDFFFVTGQIYVDKFAPKEICAQAQGFLVLVTQGLGLLIGAQAMSGIYAGYHNGAALSDWRMIWAIPAAAALIVSIVFFVMFRENSRRVTAE